jgi:hopanoid biosynthesis associated protein HpnK
MKQVVITADDAGICVETNAAIELAFRYGVLTSISVMTNMPAFDDAVAMAVRNPGLGTGVHLVLTSGRPVSSPRGIPLLVNQEGKFRHGFVGLWRLLVGRNGAAAVDQIRRELTAQVEKAVASGLAIDHVDGHRHVHMIPAIWPVALMLTRQIGSGFVRVAAEHSGTRRWPVSLNMAKATILRQCARANRHSDEAVDVSAVQHFAGVLDAGSMTLPTLMRLLKNVPDGISEIITHPSFASSSDLAARAPHYAAEDLTFLRSPRRREEAAALIHADVRRLITALQIRLTSFRELAACASGERIVKAAC